MITIWTYYKDLFLLFDSLILIKAQIMQIILITLENL